RGAQAEIPSGQLPFTVTAIAALELAYEEAVAMGHQRIEPEHLLVALALEPSAVTKSLLAGLGVDALSLRQAALARYAVSSSPRRPAQNARPTPRVRRQGRDGDGSGDRSDAKPPRRPRGPDTEP